jgi:hypothetical protein
MTEADRGEMEVVMTTKKTKNKSDDSGGGRLAHFHSRLEEILPDALASDPDSIRQAVGRAAAEFGLGPTAIRVSMDAKFDGTWSCGVPSCTSRSSSEVRDA